MTDKKEIAISTVKGLIGAIPYIGTALNETLFEYRGRLKQKRVEKFINALSESINHFNKEKIDIDQIQKDDFSDFFENLILQVARTGSESKIERFKKLLLNQLTEPIDIEYSELYLEILVTLHDKQILILSTLQDALGSDYIDAKGLLLQDKKEFDRVKETLKNKYFWLDDPEQVREDSNIQDLEKRKEELERNITTYKKQIEKTHKPYQPETYKIDGPEFFYLIQDLCNKGLLIDRGMEYGASPYELFEITQLGIDLIERVKTPDLNLCAQ